MYLTEKIVILKNGLEHINSFLVRKQRQSISKDKLSSQHKGFICNRVRQEIVDSGTPQTTFLKYFCTRGKKCHAFE